MTKVRVAETFYSVQGEGPFAGTPAVFLRLAGCNLQCGLTESSVTDFEKGQEPEDGATWICDTIDVWRRPDMTLSAEELADEWQERGILGVLGGNAHLVFTGGEPTLPPNQEAISSIVSELVDRDLHPFLEVETNGTIVPDEIYRHLIHQWNVSMKLSNSGMSRSERINPAAIKFFKSIHKADDMKDRNATFKFVVGESRDIDEIVALVDNFKIPDSMVSLMPAGQTQEQLRETYPEVAEMCKDLGWDFSPRLHISIWDEQTGV